MGTTANLPGLVAVAIEPNFRAFEAMVMRFVIDNGDLAAIAMEVTIIDNDDFDSLVDASYNQYLGIIVPSCNNDGHAIDLRRRGYGDHI